MIDFKFTQQINSSVPATFYGHFPFEQERLAVILNSRQGKTPCGQDLWVANSIKAVQKAIADDYMMLTSIGMNTWELVTWACGKYGARQIVICPISPDANIDSKIEQITSDFGLDTAKTGWLFYQVSAKAHSPKADWPIRDRLAISLAKKAIPVSVRSGGNLERLISQNSNLVLIDDFRVIYKAEIKSPSETVAINQVNTSLIGDSWDYITHWTHTVHRPWPGQSYQAFYEQLANSQTYPNSGLGTLVNIIKEKTIHGSSENIKENLSVVAFSNLKPKDMIPLLNWRKRLVRYNFEPYGIAIKRAAATNLGARPVIYGKPSLYKRLADGDKPFFQSEGVNGGNWRPENEWRFIGDFDLRVVALVDMKIIVRDKAEFEIVKTISNAEVISFT